MEMGRNLKKDVFGHYCVVFRNSPDGVMLEQPFDTERKATIKFNELKKQADWLPIKEDVTI